MRSSATERGQLCRERRGKERIKDTNRFNEREKWSEADRKCSASEGVEEIKEQGSILCIKRTKSNSKAAWKVNDISLTRCSHE